MKKEGINEYIAVGDMNQNINHSCIKIFIKENQLLDILKEINSFSDIDRDLAFKKGMNQIDVALSTNQILRYIEGSKLVNYSEIVMTDHRDKLKEIKLLEKVQQVCISRVIADEINIVGNEIWYVLNVARKKVEGN